MWRNLDPIIAEIYQAAVDPAQWPSAMSKLRHGTDAVAAQIYHWNRLRNQVDFSQICPEMDAAMVEQYNCHYAEIDPRRHLAETTPVGTLFACHEHFDEEFVRHCPVYQELLIPNGLGYSLVARVAEAPTYTASVGFNRSRSDRPWTKDEQDTVASLVFHLAQACAIQRRLSQVDLRRQAWRIAVAALPFGMMLVDGERRLVDLNPAAEQILRAGDGLISVNDRVSARQMTEAERLSALVAAAGGMDDADGARSGGAMAISRWPGGSTYTVLIAPVAASHALSDSAPSPLALMIVTDPGRRSAALARHLVSLYGLTATEASVVTTLIGGRTLDDHVRETGSKRETARWHLSNIFSKTGTHKQHELTALVLRSLANIGF